MNILYISNSRIPTEKAHGVQIINMCKSFADLGVHIKLILPKRKNLKYKDVSIFDFYSVKDNFKILKLKTFDPTWLLYISKNGLYIKFQSIFFIISLFAHLFFNKNKHDDYIFYTRDNYLLPVLQLFSNKVVLEVHDIPSKVDFYIKYWNKCFRIITITNGLRNKFIDFGLNYDKIYNAPDGVDLDKFDINSDKNFARNRLNLPINKKIIVYTGHLYEWKGTQVLADAAKQLNVYLFLFIGGTDQDVKDFKKKNSGVTNISILGLKKHNEIPFYLKAADVLVLPNSGKQKISSLYTSPIKLFEYMSSKRPIIASNLPSIAEILNDSNSVLFDADDPIKLANAIRFVLNNDILANKISTKAFMDVQQYSWFNRAKKIINNIN